MEKLIKENGGLRTQLAEKNVMSGEQRQEIDRLTHMLAATQSEREQLRINQGKQERAQVDLINQVCDFHMYY